MNVNLKLTDKWKPFFLERRRFKVAYGGRGGGKSVTIAQILLTLGFMHQLTILCSRIVQRSIKDSVYQVLVEEAEKLGLSEFYSTTQTEIRGANGTRFMFYGLHDMPSIKSMSGINICWIEEADSLTESKMTVLAPTIRGTSSIYGDPEIWLSFNPQGEDDYVYEEFCTEDRDDTIAINVNYRDNPWFPDVLRMDMERMKRTNPSMYEHVWKGRSLGTTEGHIYRKFIQPNQIIDHISVDAQYPVDTYWDIGVSDDTAIWFVQKIAGQHRFVHSHASSGEGMKYYADYLKKWGDDNRISYAKHYAPHDAGNRKLGYEAESTQDIALKLGIDFEIVPRSDVQAGIDKTRGILPNCVFSKSSCSDGIKALRAYRREFDENKNVYRSNPLHDWSSHYADAFRYFAMSQRDAKISNLNMKPMAGGRIWK